MLPKIKTKFISGFYFTSFFQIHKSFQLFLIPLKNLVSILVLLN